MKPKHNKRTAKPNRRCVRWDPTLFKSEVERKRSRRKRKSDAYLTRVGETILRGPKRTLEEWHAYFDELDFGKTDMIRFYKLCGYHLIDTLLRREPGDLFRFVVNAIPKQVAKSILLEKECFLLRRFVNCQRIAVEWGHYSLDHRMKRIGILKLLVNMNQDVVFRYVARHWHDDFVSEGFQSEFLEAIEGLDMADAFEIPEPPAVAMPGE